jgi:hypothetical protein
VSFELEVEFGEGALVGTNADRTAVYWAPGPPPSDEPVEVPDWSGWRDLGWVDET